MRIVHGLPCPCRLDGKLHPRQSTLRRMGTEVVQGLQHKHHVKLPLTPSSKLMTGQISQGRPVDSSERRRFLIARKDYDACPCGRIIPVFFINHCLSCFFTSFTADLIVILTSRHHIALCCLSWKDFGMDSLFHMQQRYLLSSTMCNLLILYNS